MMISANFQQKAKQQGILSFSIDGKKIDITPKDMETFLTNLILIDSKMPKLLSIVVQYCDGKSIPMTEIIERLQQDDPLNLQFPPFYKHKIQEMLFALALGMPISTPWDGSLPNIWTYTITDKDGAKWMFSPINKWEFGEYLTNNVKTLFLQKK